jgi:hypothetical protein
VSVDDDAHFSDGFSAAGHSDQAAVSLVGARIGGQFSMSDATVTNTLGPALVADHVTVGESAWFGEQFTAVGYGDRGAVRLSGARIAGQLNMTGVTLTNDSGPAMGADGLSVGGGVYLDHDYVAVGRGRLGAVRLHGARITGELNMSGAKLTNETGPALSADGVTVGGDASLSQGFTAVGRGDLGAVRLLMARLTGSLNMSDAKVANETGPSLFADSVTIGGSALLGERVATAGRGELGDVRLAGAHIAGQLDLSVTTVHGASAKSKWIVDGLTYSWYPTVGFDRWLVWLQKGTPTYAAQPYQQLASVARSAGHDRDARRALIAQRDDQLKRGKLTSPMKAWVRFTKYTVGYGYQPWRALLGVAGVLAIALLISFSIPDAFAHTATGASCTGVEIFQVAVDMSIPLVSTSAGSACHMTSTAGGQFVAWSGVLLTFLGWALTALFAAGFTRAIRTP